MESIDRVGSSLVASVARTVEVIRFIYLALRSVFYLKSSSLVSVVRVTLAQIYFTGAQALPLIVFLALGSGAVVIMQAASRLGMFGRAESLGEILVMIIVRELSPLMTALIVIARSGSAVVSEIGNMKVHREIDALTAMGIHPLSFVVWPRVVGGVLSVLALAFFFNLTALGGGFLVSRLFGDLSLTFFFDSVALALSGHDIWVFLLKNGLSALLIFSICCFYGFSVQSSSHEVPQAASRAIVGSIVAATLIQISVSVWLYLDQLAKFGII